MVFACYLPSGLRVYRIYYVSDLNEIITQNSIYENNLYTQVGIVLLIALASKNAILIVEFARELRAQGKPILEAAVEASRSRFRPVLMTAFSFVFGVMPLVFASGAGSASQRAVGTAVFGGMVASTALAVLFVPVFFVIFQRLSEFRRKSEEPSVELTGAKPEHTT